MSLNRSIDRLLEQARIAITNALGSPKILAYLSNFGYTEARIQSGRTRYETLLAAQQKQQSAYGNQISATETLETTWATAQKSYMRFIKVARITFKQQNGIATELALNHARKPSLSGWLSQANQFYTNALASTQILKALGEFGITAAKLKAGQSEVKMLETVSATQAKEKGEAQAATQARDAALHELQAWLSDFRAIAKVALEEDNQLLESLGILQRTA